MKIREYSVVLVNKEVESEDCVVISIHFVCGQSLVQTHALFGK